MTLISLQRQKKCSPAALVLAWISHQGEDYVPIYGTRSVERLIENAGAAAIVSSQLELGQIKQFIPSDLVFGLRYAQAMISNLDQ
jgi:aryl-alcohol dehydrogenase-like predicted oxidoreductase